MHDLCAILARSASELMSTMHAFKFHIQKNTETLDQALDNDPLVHYIVEKSHRVGPYLFSR